MAGKRKGAIRVNGEPARAPGNPPWEANVQQRQQVELWAAGGVPHEDMAQILGICAETLKRAFADELKIGKSKVLAMATGQLFKLIKEGDRSSIFFYLKTQHRWSETHKLAGPEGEPLAVDQSAIASAALIAHLLAEASEEGAGDGGGDQPA